MSKALLKPDEVRVPERIQRAITRFHAGSLSLKASAEAEGVSTGAVCYWRRRAGMPQAVRGRKRLTEPSPAHQRIIDLAGAGWSLRKIATEVGVSHQWVAYILKRWGKPPTGAKRRPAAIERASASPSLPGPKARQEPKEMVLCFRIPGSTFQRLSALAGGGPGLSSPHQFARGLVLAFLAQVAAAGLPAHASAV